MHFNKVETGNEFAIGGVLILVSSFDNRIIKDYREWELSIFSWSWRNLRYLETRLLIQSHWQLCYKPQVAIDSASSSCDRSSNLERCERKSQMLRVTLLAIYRFYGVMVSTQDSESCDPSSNLGRTWWNFFFHLNQFWYVVMPYDVKRILVFFFYYNHLLIYSFFWWGGGGALSKTLEMPLGHWRKKVTTSKPRGFSEDSNSGTSILGWWIFT